MQKSAGVPIAAAVGVPFYLCVQDGCNRKYKTPAKLIKHCVNDHQLVVSESPLTPVILTKDKKKSVEREKAANMQQKFSHDCAICFDEMVAIGVVDGCGHGFCFTCISDVKSHGLPCPKCRFPIGGISKLFI